MFSFARHLSKFHKLLIVALLVVHFLLVCVYLALNADQDKFFSTSCLWKDFGAMLSSSLTVTGSLLVYCWTSTCLIILAWLIVARLDIRKFPGFTEYNFGTRVP